jgi:hypothetical protein
MAIVRIPKTVEDKPTVVPGTYGDDQKVRIVTSEVREVPGKNESGASFWDIGVLIQTEQGGVFAHTNPFGPHNTQLANGTGSKANLFARQLGIPNPEEEFDTDDVMGKDVIAEIAVRDGYCKIVNIYEKS